MKNLLYLPELREMLAENDAAGLDLFCGELHPARTAEFMDGLTAAEKWAVLQHAEVPLRVEIFGFFEPEAQIEIVETSDRAAIAKLIGDLRPDDRVDLLNAVDPRIVGELMPLVAVDERRDIQRLSSYPEDTAGAEMTTQFARLSEELTVEQALEEISRQAEYLETIYYLYVVDEEDHLRGLVSARQLVSAMGKSGTRIGELMERDLVTVNVADDQEVVAQKVAHFNVSAIPVVDDEYHMLGIITHDDVLDVMVEEAAEDAYRIAAVDPLDESYLATPLLSLTWKRAIWLIPLLFTALVTTVTLNKFEAGLKTITWLVFFIPMVISTGGNSGSQSATLIITALSTGGITLGDWWHVVRRELAMGLLLGGLLGANAYACVLAGNAFALAWAPGPREATVIPVTVILVVICGTLCGSTLPMMFRRIGLDPAMMSNPSVAGLMDVIGIVIYMNVALIIL
jgi:magnesium transporter